jgi:hypothetical protein
LMRHGRWSCVRGTEMRGVTTSFFQKFVIALKAALPSPLLSADRSASPKGQTSPVRRQPWRLESGHPVEADQFWGTET